MHYARPMSFTHDSSAASRTKRRLLRGVLAATVITTITVLFAVAFQQVSVAGPAQRPQGPMTASSAGVWETINQFQSRDGERVVVAPSDPYVVYRFNSRTFAMQRSGDGGDSWQEVALPSEVIQSAIKTYAVFDINPLNANIAYLSAFGNPGETRSCPSPFLPGGQIKREFSCSVQYVSTNGGEKWQRLMLPSHGRLTGMLTQVFGVPRAPLLAQDSRVYSLMTINALLDEYRLVVSSDGVNWQTADSDLNATGLRIESYLASPTGSTVWTTLSDGDIWRSDDAGASWARVGPLPQNQDQEPMSLVAARTLGASASVVLYSATGTPPWGDLAPDGVRVSTDGGTTWQSSPVKGIPADQRAARSSPMTLGDGTLVALFRTMEPNIAFDEGILHTAAYYAWKPGATSWTRLTPTFDAEAVEQQWIAPASDTQPFETIWAFIYRDPELTYVEEDDYIKDGAYTISHIGLRS